MSDSYLHLLNLVSRGVPMAEARKRLGIPYHGPAEVEQLPEVVEDNEIEQLRAKLDSMGIRYHKNAKAATLKAKLEEHDLL